MDRARRGRRRDRDRRGRRRIRRDRDERQCEAGADPRAGRACSRTRRLPGGRRASRPAARSSAAPRPRRTTTVPIRLGGRLPAGAALVARRHAAVQQAGRPLRQRVGGHRPRHAERGHLRHADVRCRHPVVWPRHLRRSRQALRPERLPGLRRRSGRRRVDVEERALAAIPSGRTSRTADRVELDRLDLVDPTDPTGRTIYVGTGEPNGSSDSEAGVGLYKSTDGGRSWTSASRAAWRCRRIARSARSPSTRPIRSTC